MCDCGDFYTLKSVVINSLIKQTWSFLFLDNLLNSVMAKSSSKSFYQNLGWLGNGIDI